MNKIKQVFDSTLVLLQPRSIELGGVLSFLLSESTTVADIGCGRGGHLADVTKATDSIWIGIDSHAPSLESSMRQSIYDNVYCTDALSWLKKQKSNSIDTIIACCLIEHLEKDQGRVLLNEMSRVCERLAVVVTPNGYVPQPPDPDNAGNAHLSGWSSMELEEHGFQVEYGVNGIKQLRTTYALPRLKPIMFGDLLSKATARVAAIVPRIAYQLVACHRKS